MQRVLLIPLALAHALYTRVCWSRSYSGAKIGGGTEREGARKREEGRERIRGAERDGGGEIEREVFVGE